jgi:hypothetical protein
MEVIFTDFYLNDYNTLSQYTMRMAEARPAVAAAFERGRDVVIATNPLFPAIAIRQRLAWGAWPISPTVW